jgi:hypothetical protein
VGGDQANKRESGVIIAHVVSSVTRSVSASVVYLGARIRRDPWTRMLGLTLTLVLALGGASLQGADSQNPPPQSPAAAPARQNEIKLFVTAVNAQQAIAALELDEHRAVKGIVCFFETSAGALEANDLILRARQMGAGTGDFTVKLRATAGATELSAVERAIQPEWDWTREDQPTLSRSIDRKSLAKGLVAKVAAGQVAVAELFSEPQRQLVMGRMKDFNVGSLRRYGPVEALVWRQQGKLHGFREKVTVELWHLRKDGQMRDVLEVSAKATTETEEQALALAKQFFGAAKAAGLGEPAGQTKTKTALDFFRPGR